MVRKKLKPLCTVSGNIKWATTVEKCGGSYSKNLNTELLYEPIIPALGIHSQELNSRIWIDRYTSSCRRIIHNNSKVKEAQISTDRQIDEQNAEYTYNGILFSLKKEENSDTCFMSEPGRHYAEWNTRRYILLFHSHELLTGTFIEAESRILVSRSLGGEGIGSYYLMGIEKKFQRWLAVMGKKMTHKNSHCMYTYCPPTLHSTL
jgi:hypothetical protein